MTDLTFFAWGDMHFGYEQKFFANDLRGNIIRQMNELSGWLFPDNIGGTVNEPDFVIACGDMVDGEPEANEQYELDTYKFFCKKLKHKQHEGDNYATSIFAFSKRYKFSGDKPNDLICSECSEQLVCSESILNQEATINGDEVTHERVGRNKCVWTKEADIGDDEMCMLEFSNGVQGSYIQTFYTPGNYKGRVYTVIGKEGVMDIDVGHYKGKISVHQRYGTKGDSTTYNFDYLSRNHYNGDTYIVRNFIGIIQGTEEPFTTAEAAIAAENTGLAAVRSVKNRRLESVKTTMVKKNI